MLSFLQKFTELEEHGTLCSKCCLKLDELYKFRELCLKNKQMFIDHFKENNKLVYNEGNCDTNNETFQNNAPLDIKVKIEIVEDDICETYNTSQSANDNILENRKDIETVFVANDVIKSEPEEFDIFDESQGE